MFINFAGKMGDVASQLMFIKCIPCVCLILIKLTASAHPRLECGQFGRARCFNMTELLMSDYNELNVICGESRVIFD